MMPLNYVTFTKIFVLCLMHYLTSADTHGPIVNTTLGLVRGSFATDGDYSMFLGIPFAKVNENNPFGLAIPHPGFQDIFEANDDSAICPQEEEFNNTIVGTLDCLHLSVFVPSSASSTNLLPIFVWLYGGGFEIGFYGRFLYGPKFLVRQDIILITLNYRVGPYGFMCTDTPEIPGNQGLKDQLIALRWIQENIAAFGGDPDKVTMGGNSAGGMSLDYHIMRKNEGPQLFHKAIFQSGTTFSLGAANSIKNAPLLMAQHLGLHTSDMSEAISFLAKVDPHVIIATMQELNQYFGPCIEKEIEGMEAFITENWSSVTEVPAVKDMPIMIGFNNEELLLFGLFGFNNPYVVFFFLASVFESEHEDFGSMVEVVQHFYFGDQELNSEAAANCASDLNFIYPAHRSIERFLDNDAGNVYLYMFSYDGGRNFVKHRENITVGGAAHADEVGYLFDISYMEDPLPSDQMVVDRMTTMSANFVKYGDPTPQTSDLLPYKWEPIKRNSPYHYMELDQELRVGTRPLHDRMGFWDLFYEGYGHLQRATSGGEVYRLLKKFIY